MTDGYHCIVINLGEKECCRGAADRVEMCLRKGDMLFIFLFFDLKLRKKYITGKSDIR